MAVATKIPLLNILVLDLNIQKEEIAKNINAIPKNVVNHDIILPDGNLFRFTSLDIIVGYSDFSYDTIPVVLLYCTSLKNYVSSVYLSIKKEAGIVDAKFEWFS